MRSGNFFSRREHIKKICFVPRKKKCLVTPIDVNVNNRNDVHGNVNSNESRK